MSLMMSAAGNGDAAEKRRHPRGCSVVNSIGSLLAQLDDGGTEAKVQAMQMLTAEVVDRFWPEIADSLLEIETLAADASFPRRQTASLVASSVYFHLEEYEEALRFALGAGDELNLTLKTPYTETIITKAVEAYIQHRQLTFEAKSEVHDYTPTSRSGTATPALRGGTEAPSKSSFTNWGRGNTAENQLMSIGVDRRLEELVDRLLESCTDKADPRESLGVVFDSCRLDKVEEILTASNDLTSTLRYCANNAATLIQSQRFRQEVYALLVKFYDAFDAAMLRNCYPELLTCLFHLRRDGTVAKILSDLIASSLPSDEDLEGEKDSSAASEDVTMTENAQGGPKEVVLDVGVLTAYQLAFDIVEYEDQAFLSDILEHECLQEILDPNEQIGSPIDASKADASSAPSDAKATDGNSDQLKTANVSAASASGGEGVTDSQAETPQETAGEKARRQAKQKYLSVLRRILTGETSIDLTLQLLHRANRTDLLLLDKMRSAADQRNSVVHTALVTAHSFMQSGTTCDVFLRQNLDWLGRAVEWAKFGATASIGVIHKGHIKQSRTVLSTYLPGGGGGAFSEGGALYALGLIHANRQDSSAKEYILGHLKNADNSDVKMHGACLGLGLLCMGSGDEELYEELKAVLFKDSAVAGEAAGLAIGLVMLGTASTRIITELLAYARETQHEKISRACMTGVALIMYLSEQDVDNLADQLGQDNDAHVRQGAMAAVGLAYCGTSANSAVRRLLHASASDVSDDVRRTAVMGLGFVLCNQPDQVANVLSLLSESFNPNVRYASTMAVAIACAGCAKESIVTQLLAMTKDSADFVRQGALLALGLVLMQCPDSLLPAGATNIRETFLKIASDKHEDLTTRFGAILAQGLIDAGGRNVSASLYSSTGHLRRQAVVGYFLFTQFWYWYPLVHAICLAFRPTSLVGLNKDMAVPSDFFVYCPASVSSFFDYPAPTTKERKEDKRGAVTAVLSTSKKHQAQEKRRLELSASAAKLHKHHNKPPQGSGSTTSATDVQMRSSSADGSSASVVSETRSSRAAEISSTTATVGDAAEAESTTSTENKARRELADDEDRIASIDKAHGAAANAAIGTAAGGRGSLTQLSNPCRILKRQERHVSFNPEARFVPLFRGRKAGFVLLRDTRPVKEEPTTAGDTDTGETELLAEPAAPEPFEWDGE